MDKFIDILSRFEEKWLSGIDAAEILEMLERTSVGFAVNSNLESKLTIFPH